MHESDLMFTNHHIAMQLAAERQRDLRGQDGGRRVRDRFAAGAAQRAADEVFVAPAPGELRFAAVVPSRDPHLPEPRIRRTPAGQNATWGPALRHGREARHGETVGS